MKKLQNVAIIVSVLVIGNYSYTTDSQGDQADLQRYYGGPSSPDSYIDTNKSISMESYIITNPYPNNYPGGPAGEYNGPKSLNQKYFQPSDGSLTTGTYDVRNKTATTPLHNYKEIVIVDGTYKTPQLNPKAQYIDKQGNALRLVGSLTQRSEDESDTFVYYLFGKIDDPKNYDGAAKKATNMPTQTYDSQGE